MFSHSYFSIRYHVLRWKINTTKGLLIAQYLTNLVKCVPVIAQAVRVQTAQAGSSGMAGSLTYPVSMDPDCHPVEIE